MEYKLSELIVLNIYLGTIVWVTGAIAQTYLLKGSALWLPVARRAVVIVAAFLLTEVIALAVWLKWDFPFDIMAVQFIHLPTLAAEILVTLMIVSIKRIYPR